jgi:hypothetical protein
MLREPLHGVVVSVGHADYLDVSLRHNRPQFDTVVVATSPDDLESQRVAARHDCTVVISDDWRREGSDPRGNGRVFNKGRMVERALQQLPNGGWRVHCDADIVWPGNCRQRLALALYDRHALYGLDRFNVVGEEAYQRLVSYGWTTQGFEHHHYLVYPMHQHEVQSRLVYGDQGWVPVGFFQCWHADSEFGPGGSRVRTYPTGSNSAAHDDVQFALRWDRHKRIHIPDLLVAHLVTEDATYGVNWSGRKTRRWGKRPATIQEPTSA